jgi:hypothetical protein
LELLEAAAATVQTKHLPISVPARMVMTARLVFQ